VESLGEKLRTTRESKGISLDQVGMDTRLAIRYLEALENENFSQFPGEAYITGFIRNYGTYLELDVDALLAMYRAVRIQEQPVPVEHLLKKPSMWPKIAIGVVVAFLVLGLAAGLFLFLTGRPANAVGVVRPERVPVEYIMGDDSFEHRFFKGDSLLLSLDFDLDFPAEDSGQYRLELVNVVDDDVVIGTRNGPILVDLSRNASLDLDGNGTPDVRIIAIDYARNDVGMGALLRFERYTALSFLPELEVVPAGSAAVTGQSLSSVIFSSPSPYPFTLQANFQRGGMFRWEVLAEPARRERNERFFQNLDELTVPQVRNGVRVWTSNAQSARFQVIGGGRAVPVELGSHGEVVVVDIRWIRGDDNVFRLMVTRLEA